MRQPAQCFAIAMLLASCLGPVDLGSDVDGSAGGSAAAGGGGATGGGAAGGGATGGGATTSDAGPDGGIDAGLVIDAGLPSGQLDVTFNLTGFAIGTTAQATAYGVAHDSQGRIVISGISSPAAATVWRLAPNGTFDVSFRDGGAWTLASMSALSVAVDAQDRPVVSGSVPGVTVAVVRLDVGGSFDPSFADAGFASFPNVAERGRAVRVLPNTDIIVAGNAGNSTGVTDAGIQASVVRLSSSGALKSVAIVPGTLGSVTNDQAMDVAIDSSGRIVATGLSGDAQRQPVAALWRFTADGGFDTTFADGGRALFVGIAGGPIGPTHNDTCNGIALDAQGRILVGGYSYRAGFNFPFVGRMSADGVPDPTFGDAGFVLLPGGGVVQDIGIDSLGQIVAAGSTGDGGGQISVAVWRLRSDGELDVSFGDHGLFTTTGAAGGNRDYARALSIDAQRRPVVVGVTTDDAGVVHMGAWRVTQ